MCIDADILYKFTSIDIRIICSSRLANKVMSKYRYSTGPVLALSIYTSSYTSEIVRSALQAVPKGQWEAATAVGMNTFEKIFYVVAPQAWKLTLPPLAGVYVLVIKGTSILSVIGVVELMRTGEDSIYRYPSHIMLILGMVAVMYFLYCYPILKLIRHMELRVGRIERLKEE